MASATIAARSKQKCVLSGTAVLSSSHLTSGPPVLSGFLTRMSRSVAALGSLLGAAAHTSRGGLVDVSSWDPALVVTLRARCDCRSISSNNGNLLAGVDLLVARKRCLSSFSALAAALLLRQKILEPDCVDGENSATKDTSENEIEEDARR